MPSKSQPIDAAIGMMDSAYFTSRKDVLDWINQLLSLNLTKIEQTATGAVACQLADFMFPGTLRVGKVNWSANTQYDYVNNYKLLQDCFNKNNVSRHVDVDKLIRGKYQDNLEFMQWFKAFFDQVAVTREDYDPLRVRQKGKGGANATKFLNEKAKGGTKLLPTDREKAKKVEGEGKEAKATSNKVSRVLKEAGNVDKTNDTKGVKASKKQPEKGVRRTQSAKGRMGTSTSTSADSAKLMKKNTELTKEVDGLKVAVDGLEKERDFYFEKLRDIEVMLQAFQEKEGKSLEMGNKVVEDVFRVLYATTEESITVRDDGTIIEAEEAAVVQEGRGEEEVHVAETVVEEAVGHQIPA
mmetsp:Transcript_16316/g.33579  ORF Transcript_16316/g.33579 Transcript_16316/m.33579 type:complete len:354 (-) Transcript_16316:111-1172(-)|eukprot:CAMPEP_0118661344 /NCGR_PEP_ID=MMETSP0785-20121206/16223_1 /TAXON_ID=91992 /ORGANISM="Bolidomonas pacifica, Strain CCMP 1866" /LENGTH=353 /DNA_ID=CAMNT_0006554765 /DNA_START=18 /DNA_END=1079 /DNA_ORIENTATION=+